jgi:hypothetical protein
MAANFLASVTFSPFDADQSNGTLQVSGGSTPTFGIAGTAYPLSALRSRHSPLDLLLRCIPGMVKLVRCNSNAPRDLAVGRSKREI